MAKIEVSEERPGSSSDEWRRRRVAHILFDSKSGLWSLYCRDRYYNIHYYDLAPTADFDAIVNELERDPTGIFWG